MTTTLGRGTLPYEDDGIANNKKLSYVDMIEHENVRLLGIYLAHGYYLKFFEDYYVISRGQCAPGRGATLKSDLVEKMRAAFVTMKTTANKSFWDATGKLNRPMSAALDALYTALPPIETPRGAYLSSSHADPIYK